MRPKHHINTEIDYLDCPDRVLGWRRELLERAGFDRRLAVLLAASPVDLHALIGLVEYGCPPRLAARILAPLESEETLC